MIAHRKTADAHHRRCRQFLRCPGGFDSFLRQIRPWSRTTGVNSEPNGLPISDGRETVAARHRRELAEFLASSPRRSPRLRGLSLQSRGAVTTITDVLVLSVLTKDPVPPTPSPSKMRGRSPRSGRSVPTLTDFQILSALPNDPSPFTLPLPEAAGIVPATGGAE